VTHAPNGTCATFLFLPHFDLICDLLLNRRTATYNLFVNGNNSDDRCDNDVELSSISTIVPIVAISLAFFYSVAIMAIIWKLVVERILQLFFF